jgi:hypothetical protein
VCVHGCVCVCGCVCQAVAASPAEFGRDPCCEPSSVLAVTPPPPALSLAPDFVPGRDPPKLVS